MISRLYATTDFLPGKSLIASMLKHEKNTNLAWSGREQNEYATRRKGGTCDTPDLGCEFSHRVVLVISQNFFNRFTRSLA